MIEKYFANVYKKRFDYYKIITDGHEFFTKNYDKDNTIWFNVAGKDKRIVNSFNAKIIILSDFIDALCNNDIKVRFKG